MVGCGDNTAEQLISTAPLAAGSTACAAGGVAISIGGDSNGNGTLDASEVTSTQNVCNTPGSITTLTPAAPDATCPGGGVLVQTGGDTNGDGMLETGEVGSTQEICTAPTPTLTTVLPVAGGDVHCPIGGTAVETGLDTNANGMLDASEVAATDYECLTGPGGVDVQAFTPPAAVPNQPAYTIGLSGGAGTTDNGGDAGYFSASQYGSSGRHFAVWSTGVVDASFTTPAVAPSFGAYELDVTTDTTLAQDNGGSNTADGNYYIDGNTLSYRQDATHLFAVTGLHVADGKTLTLPVQLSGLVNDISIEGTVVTATNSNGDASNLTLVSSSLVYIAATGKIDTSGAAVTAARGGNSGHVYLQAAQVVVKGPIVAHGAAGATSFNGGNSNGVEVYSDRGGVYITATIDARGGMAGDAASAGNGGSVNLSTNSGSLANSGAIDARGGDGLATGVAASGGGVSFNINTSGTIRNSGAIDTSGGNTPATCTASSCFGGSAGSVYFQCTGGSVATSGDVTQRGGTGGGAGGGNGGYTTFQFNTGYNNNFYVPAGAFSVSGNYHKEGGAGTRGGIGGGFNLYGNAYSATSAAQFQFFGYSDVTANGGAGLGGGRGGDINVTEQPYSLYNGYYSSTNTGSALLWFANVSTNGGAGTANNGGDGGNLSLRACDYPYLAFGCLVENRGSITANGGSGNHHGGASGNIYMKGQSGIANAGALIGHAGAGQDQPGGDTQNVQLYTTGPLTNSGAIDLVAGDSDSAHGGNCDGVQLYGSTTTNTGAITEAAGSSTTGVGGDSNQIALYGSSALTNTGVLAAPGGTGVTDGVDGTVMFNNVVQN